MIYNNRTAFVDQYIVADVSAMQNSILLNMAEMCCVILILQVRLIHCALLRL